MQKIKITIAMHIPWTETVVNQSYSFLKKKKKKEGKKKKRETLTALLNRKTRARSKKKQWISTWEQLGRVASKKVWSCSCRARRSRN